MIWPLDLARAEMQKYFCSFFGSNESFKICFRDLLTFRLLAYWTFSMRHDCCALMHFFIHSKEFQFVVKWLCISTFWLDCQYQRRNDSQKVHFLYQVNISIKRIVKYVSGASYLCRQRKYSWPRIFLKTRVLVCIGWFKKFQFEPCFTALTYLFHYYLYTRMPELEVQGVGVS